MRNLIISVILIAWFLLGFAYCNLSEECCQTDTSPKKELSTPIEKVESEPAVKLGPLNFNWSDSITLTGDGWAKYKQSLISKLNDNQLMEIVGLYSGNETNNTSFENLGIARAHAARQLFAEMPDEKFRLLSKLIDSIGVQTNTPFESVNFDYKINTTKIKEIDQKTLIYFPFNSTNKLNDSEVESYLDDVVENLKGNSKRVSLIGHTDNIGSSASNVVLGQKRADIIRRYLISKGLTPNRIIATSEGEQNPVDTNNSKEGRANNRRTELEIIN